jgi:hypothetical protein
VTAPLIENTVHEPPPLRRAVVGMLLGLVVGGLAAVALPRERSAPAPSPVPR